MVRLNNPHSRDLSKEDFEKYPIWVWDDANEGYLPISDGKYTEEYGTLFIKATFQVEQIIFPGYLVGSGDFYAFGLFVNKEEVGFNINFSLSFMEKDMDRMFHLLKCKPFNLFPLIYTSPVCFEDGKQISGKFILEGESLHCLPDYIPKPKYDPREYWDKFSI